MGCANSVYAWNAPTVILVCSDKKEKESKNLITFCEYLKISYQISRLENYRKDDSPPDIGLFVDKLSFSYSDFLKYHDKDITFIIKKVEEAKREARFCKQGRYR